MGFILGILLDDARSRLNLTSTAPTHATGQSQSESMTGSECVAESSTIAERILVRASQRETRTDEIRER